MKKENKRKFNIFVSILTCFIITLACLSPSFISFASENFDLIEMLDIQDEFITASDLGDGTYNYFVQDNTYEQNYHDMYSNGFNYNANNAVSNQLNSLDFNKYVGAYKSDFTQFILYYLPENSFIVQNNQLAIIFAEVQYTDVGAGYNAGFPVFRSSDGVQFSVDWQTVGYGSTVDGVSYSTISLSTSNGAFDNICSCNIPVYYYDSNNFSFDSLDDLEKLNNPIAGGCGGYSEANILSNNYLGSNNSIYMSGARVNNSILHILLDFNRNQMTQQNIDPNKLTYDIHMDWIVQGTCTADSKSRQMLNYYFGDGTANWWDNLNGKTYNFDTAFQGSWTGLSASNVNEISSTIYNDGIYANGKPGTTMANYLSTAVNTSNTVSDTKSFFDSFKDVSIAGYSINSMANSNHTSITTCYYDVSVDVYYDGNKINDNPITARCDWLNGKQEMIQNVSASDVSQAVANNNNGLPITDPNYKDPNGYEGTIQIVDNSTGGSGGSGGNIESGAIVINNNPTFNNNTFSSSSSFGSGGLIPFILGAIIGNNKSSSDTISSMTGANGWLQVISSTWQWIPTQIWTVILTAFQAIIGICVVAFIISIIIRFIT